MAVFPETMTQDALVTCVLMGCITIVGLVGNALMLRALFKYPRLRTEFYIVFGSLSLADSIFLVVGTIVQTIDMMGPFEIITTPWCRGTFYIMTACGFIAGYLIVVLAVLRGILLTNRNTIRRPQAKHLLFVSGVLFVLAGVSSVPLTLIYKGSKQNICNFDDTTLKRETWILSSFLTFVPIVLVFIIYFMTYWLGKRYFSDSYSPREKEKARLVTSTIIAFGICQIPFRVASIYDTYIDSKDYKALERSHMIKTYLMCLVMVDKAVRPILCSKLASDLSEAFDEIINCTYCSKPYTMAPVFDNNTYHAAPLAPYECESPRTLTTYVSSSDSHNISSTDSGNGSGTERTTSTSSSASANSQTPLTRRENEVIEMNGEIS